MTIDWKDPINIRNFALLLHNKVNFYENTVVSINQATTDLSSLKKLLVTLNVSFAFRTFLFGKNAIHTPCSLLFHLLAKIQCVILSTHSIVAPKQYMTSKKPINTYLQSDTLIAMFHLSCIWKSLDYKSKDLKIYIDALFERISCLCFIDTNSLNCSTDKYKTSESEVSIEYICEMSTLFYSFWKSIYGYDTISKNNMICVEIDDKCCIERFDKWILNRLNSISALTTKQNVCVFFSTSFFLTHTSFFTKLFINTFCMLVMLNDLLAVQMCGLPIMNILFKVAKTLFNIIN